MKLNEALDLLQKNGAKVKSLNETTAITTPNFIIQNEFIDVLEKVKDWIRNDADEETSDVADALIKALDKALDNEELMAAATNEFLDKIGFTDAFEKAWDE